jgi:hypothetical protein
MTILNDEEWKIQVGIKDHKHDILHLTEQEHGIDTRVVIDEYLKNLYDIYVAEQGENNG